MTVSYDHDCLVSALFAPLHDVLGVFIVQSVSEHSSQCLSLILEDILPVVG